MFYDARDHVVRRTMAEPQRPLRSANRIPNVQEPHPVRGAPARKERPAFRGYKRPAATDSADTQGGGSLSRILHQFFSTPAAPEALRTYLTSDSRTGRQTSAVNQRKACGAAVSRPRKLKHFVAYAISEEIILVRIHSLTLTFLFERSRRLSNSNQFWICVFALDAQAVHCTMVLAILRYC